MIGYTTRAGWFSLDFETYSWISCHTSRRTLRSLPHLLSHGFKFLLAGNDGNKKDKSPVGLLQSLPIPNSICEDISIDFITGLPRSHRVDCILVVVDRLSKLAHFLNLRHPFTARTMAKVFTREIVRLYGIPKTIVSDWDPVCFCNFWSELSPMQGTQLNSTYHPQTDGQTKVSNR